MLMDVACGSERSSNSVTTPPQPRHNVLENCAYPLLHGSIPGRKPPHEDAVMSVQCFV